MAGYKAGDLIEGQFTEDDVWYPAKIDAVQADGTYAVTYTEYGNSEVIPAARVRPVYKAGDLIEGQFTEDDVWYPAKIDAAQGDGKYAVTYTEYGNSEVIPVERIRLPAQAAAAAPAASKWKAGDLIEGQFTEDDVWYPAKIDAVQADGTYAVTYTEYGNSEVIPVERIRAPQAAPAAAAPAAVETVVETPAPAPAAEDSWTSSSSTFAASSDFSSTSYASNDKPATNTLFVGGLSFNTDENSLQGAFERFGNFSNARVVKDRDSGKSKGFGYVEFFDVETAQKALTEMNGQDLDGRTLRIDFSQPRTGGGGGGGSRSTFSKEPRSGGFGSGGFGGGSSRSSDKTPTNILFVGGLSFDTDENSLQAAFAEFGDIDKVRIAKDRDSGSSKGFGYVEFYSVEVAEKAMKEANGREVDGRSIRLDFSQPKGSGGPGAGKSGGFGSSSGSSGFGSSSGTSSGFGSSGFGSGQESSGFGSNSRRENPVPAGPPKPLEEPFDPSSVNPNRKVTVTSSPADGPILIVTRSFQEAPKKSSLFAHLSH